MAKSRAEERSESRNSARRRAETHQSFERTVFQIPDGIPVIQLKTDTIRKFDILNYTVGDGSGQAGKNPYADPGMEHYERTFWTHRNIGPDGKSSYICPAKTVGKRCPICDFRAKEARKPNGDTELIKALDLKERQIFAVIDCEDRDKGVQLLELSFHNFGKQLDKRIKNDPDQAYDNFADIENGMTLVCGVESKSMGKGRPFACIETIDFKPRRVQYDDSLKAEIPCLDDLLIVLPYAKLEQVFLQTSDEDTSEGDDPETEPPAPPAKSTAARGRPVEEPEEEAPPPKPKAKAPPPKAEEPEEEPEPEETVTAESLGLAVGDTVFHKEHGRCTIVKVGKDGTRLTIEDEEENLQAGVPVTEVSKPKPKTAPPKEEAKAPPKKAPPKKEEPKDDSADDWNDDWSDEPPPKKK